MIKWLWRTHNTHLWKIYNIICVCVCVCVCVLKFNDSFNMMSLCTLCTHSTNEEKKTHFHIWFFFGCLDVFRSYYVVILKLPNIQSEDFTQNTNAFFSECQDEWKKTPSTNYIHAPAIMQTRIYSFKDIYMKIHYNIAHLIYDYCRECSFRFIFEMNLEQ